ncbi:MAG: CDP-diacylglycerol--glycerol-3-phosphate 3-phosphatidyltransferase [Eubacteriales bacterium]|nr:CDP-diacylglycerol--glycerol-3-phosphate 3-phosphatidyltransferase [Eubacteriales bacterium]
MNLPNKLSLLRLILIPFFVLFFTLSESFYLNSTLVIYFRYIAAFIFIIASLTDYFDGEIARKNNLITNFGKLIDPLADKTLVCCTLICLSNYEYIPLFCTLICIFREFMISTFRLVAVEQGVVIAASKWGKYKTASQMISIVLILCNIHTINKYLYYLTYIIFYVSIILTIISLIDYVFKNKDVILNSGV